MALLAARPVLPVSHVGRAVDYYVTRLGFHKLHDDANLGVVGRDDVRIRLSASTRSEAGRVLPGTASCRVTVPDLDALHALYQEFAARDLLDPPGGVVDRPWGSEFAVLDLDRNAITFQPARHPPD